MQNIDKEAIEARVIGVKITWVSNYRCPITESSNRTVVIGHPRDRAPITRGEPIAIENFVIDTINTVITAKRA